MPNAGDKVYVVTQANEHEIENVVCCVTAPDIIMQALDERYKNRRLKPIKWEYTQDSDTWRGHVSDYTYYLIEPYVLNDFANRAPLFWKG